MPIEIKEILAKSILSPSKLKEADYDYSCNPYIGCRFGCVYCYASFMGRFVGKSISDWGSYVFAKINAPELLAKEIRKMPKKGRGKTIWFSSVTDPYQGLEAKYRLTGKCLEILLKEKFTGEVSFLTKSDLVLRDLEILQQLPKVEVGLTITSTEDSIARYFEKYAPPASARLGALKKLNQAGIKTYAFIGPLLPHFVAQQDSLEKLFKAVRDAGVTDIYLEHLNLKPYILKRLKSELKDLDLDLWQKFYESRDPKYRDELNKLLKKLIKKYGFNLRLGSVLYHQDMK